MDATSTTWHATCKLHNLSAELDRARKASEKELAQITQYITGGKVTSTSTGIGVQKITKLKEKLHELKRVLADRARKESLNIMEVQKLVHGPPSDLQDCISRMLAAVMARGEHPGTARLIEMSMGGVPDAQDSVTWEYQQLRAGLLSKIPSVEILAFVATLRGLTSPSDPKGLYRDFLSLFSLYSALSRSPETKDQIECVQSQCGEVEDGHKRLFVSQLMGGGNEVEESLLNSFDRVFEQFTNTIGPPIETLLIAGISALKVPGICSESSSSACMACLAGEGIPGVHKTQSVLLQNIDSEELYVTGGNVVVDAGDLEFWDPPRVGDVEANISKLILNQAASPQTNNQFSSDVKRIYL